MYLLDSQTSRLTSPYDTIDATLLVNSLLLEPYLKGVVPVEIPSSAPLEALKAQAVAARSFAAHPSRDRPGAAKLVDSVLDQAYRGFDFETAVTSSAVDSTAGEIRRFTSNSSLAITEYSSSTGGYTAGGTYPAAVDLEDDTFTCTGGATNIIVGETTADGSGIVRAPGCASGSSRVQLNARHRWRASVPVGVVESSYGVNGLQQVRVDARDGRGEWGGRALGMTIVAAGGSRTSSGTEFSSRFMSYGVYSRWFNIETGSRITSVNSGKVLDVFGASTADGARIIQWPWNGGANQQWRLVAVSTTTYAITSVGSGKVIDVEGASTADGARIIQWPWHGGANQQWRVETAGDGVVKFVSALSGKVIDVTRGSTADGAQVIQWPWNGGPNQQWRVSTAG